MIRSSDYHIIISLKISMISWKNFLNPRNWPSQGFWLYYVIKLSWIKTIINQFFKSNFLHIFQHAFFFFFLRREEHFSTQYKGRSKSFRLQRVYLLTYFVTRSPLRPVAARFPVLKVFPRNLEVTAVSAKILFRLHSFGKSEQVEKKFLASFAKIYDRLSQT